jgi:hypothetical protein
MREYAHTVQSRNVPSASLRHARVSSPTNKLLKGYCGCWLRQKDCLMSIAPYKLSAMLSYPILSCTVPCLAVPCRAVLAGMESQGRQLLIIAAMISSSAPPRRTVLGGVAGGHTVTYSMSGGRIMKQSWIVIIVGIQPRFLLLFKIHPGSVIASASIVSVCHWTPVLL